MSGAGFDWLNLTALKSDSDLPPPPVSFGVTPTSSSSSLNLVQKSHSQIPSQNGSKEDLIVPETEEDLNVPLNLSADQLTREEAKTYLRWYNDIVVRRGTKLIRLQDVFQFLNNFNLSNSVKRALEKIFRFSVSLNIGEFFACLRLIAHIILSDETPRRLLIRKPAPLLKPKSILSGKRKQDSDDDEDELSHSAQNSTDKLDIESFTKFILTGSRPEDALKPARKLKSRRVKFSDEVSVEPTQIVNEVEPVKIDMSLPMDQLLKSMPAKQPTANSRINEEEELKEMEDQINHFQDVKNVDSALIHGVPANIPQIFFDELNNNGPPAVPSPDSTSQQLLQQKQQQQQQQQEKQEKQHQLLSPNHTGPVRLLSPNHTDPVPFGTNILSPNLTGGAPSNGYLSPNFTGQQQDTTFLQPAMTGSLSDTMRQNIGLGLQQDQNKTLAPPIPPRSRSSSSPIPFQQQQQPQLQQQQYSIDTTIQQPHPELQSHLLYQHRTSSPLSPPLPPPPPPPSRRSRSSSLQQLQTPAPPPPPSRSPVLPPKIPLQSSSSPYQNNQNGSIYDRVLQDYNVNGVPVGQQQQPQPQQQQLNNPYQQNQQLSGSTSDILGDLRALQSEVERLQQWQR